MTIDLQNGPCISFIASNTTQNAQHTPKINTKAIYSPQNNTHLEINLKTFKLLFVNHSKITKPSVFNDLCLSEEKYRMTQTEFTTVFLFSKFKVGEGNRYDPIKKRMA